MKFVGVRELKDKLSSYMRAAQAGERIIVTDRGRAVAELGPTVGSGGDPIDALRDLVERGLITVGGDNRQAAYPKFEKLLPAGEAQRLLEETRGEN